MAAPVLVDFVEFRALGLAEIEEGTRRLGASVEAAHLQQVSLSQALADPVYRAHAVEVDRLTRANQQLLGVELERGRQADRRDALDSGRAVKTARERLELEREATRLAARERAAANEARYGRLGGGLANVMDNRGVKAASWGATGLAGAAVAGATSGFGGTVEWNRLQSEIQGVNRALAGAFKPAIEGITAAVNRLRRWLEGLSESQQNMLAATAGTVLALGAANKGLGLLGTSLPGIVGGLARLAAGQAAGSAAGSLAGGVAKEAGGSILGGLVTRGGLTSMSRAGPWGVAAAAIGGAGYAGYEAYREGGYYDALRKGKGEGQGIPRGSGVNGGYSRLGAAFYSYGSAVHDLSRDILPESMIGKGESGRYKTYYSDKLGVTDRGARLKALEEEDAKKGKGGRLPTKADAGYSGGGEAYERIQTALSMIDTDNNSADAKIARGIGDIKEILERQFGKSEAPPPG